LRVGDLRIVYLVEGDVSVVVLRVVRRSERTYRHLDR
jgi:mRNA-degrading endonuclease RelE of RelBE toxin-antitoxin system